MLHDIIFLIMGIALLTLGGNFVTDGAVAIARKFNVSNMMIGLTVVAFGSSMPDLVVCLTSTLSGKTQMALGDVVGSNIFDILLVFGIMALIRPLKMDHDTIYHDLPMLAFSSLALFICGDDILFDGAAADTVNRTDGLMFLALLVIFEVYNIQNAKRQKLEMLACPPQSSNPQSGGKPRAVSGTTQAFNVVPSVAVKIGKVNARNVRADKPLKPWLSWVYVAGGLAALVVGGNWVVSGASGIALRAGLSEATVGLTVVALGSASPDLASSLAALFKGKAGLAIGNIVGACILNVFGLIGICATVHPLESGTISLVDYSTLAGGSLLLWLMTLLNRRHTLTRLSGALLILAYIAYMTYLVLTSLH